MLSTLAKHDDVSVVVQSYWELSDLQNCAYASKACYAFALWLRGVLARNGLSALHCDTDIDEASARKLRTEARLLRAQADWMGQHGNTFVTWSKCCVARSALRNLAAFSVEEQRPTLKRARKAIREAKRDNLQFVLRVVANVQTRQAL